MELNLNKQNLKDTFAEYEPLLCNACKDNLKLTCLPIMERLNKGKKPKLGQVVKLMGCLCPKCQMAITQKKMGGFHG